MNLDAEQMEVSSPLKLGQFYYHDDEGWSMVCGIYKTMLAVYAIDKLKPSLYYQNKDYPPISAKRVDCDYKPLMYCNSDNFNFDDNIYYLENAAVHKALMMFHVGADKIQIDCAGEIKQIDKSLAFKIRFV